MATTTVDTFSNRLLRLPALRLARDAWLRLAALSAILLLAAGLRFANLEALGYGNHYYTAAVESMLQSWHNFFFVAAEPGGAVSVDKPPLGLWVQTASAYLFGVNGFAVILPEIIAGLLSVAVLYHLVRRRFGTAAGLLAALALAITPIVVATDRNNTIDSQLILVLLLATWAFMLAAERGKLRYLLLGAFLVGLGFNIKMLQAYLPLPAFFGLYFLGSREGWWRKLGNLALASVLLLVVSFSWAVAVDLTPADQRPYVGSSGDNSVLSLAIGYNGVNRLLGMGGGRAALGGGVARTDDGNRNFQPGQRLDDGNGNLQPGQGGIPGAGGFNGGFAGGPVGGPRGAGGGGFPGTGQAGALRLFIPPLSKEVSWLLPFGLVSLGLLVVRARRTWPLSTQGQAAVLWGGWLVTGGTFFSVAGFFHEYYLSMLAAPLAALVAIGTVELWKLRESRPWRAAGLLLVAAGATLSLQLYTAANYVGTAWWLAAPVALFVAGAALLLLATRRNWLRGALSGFVFVAAAILLIPGMWAGLTNANSSANQSLPAAYGGQESTGPADRGNVMMNEALLNYLEANTQGMEYLMAVPSSMQGADYVIATGRPVLYMGGFNGEDEVVTADSLAQLVADGRLRYIYWNANGGNGPGFGGGSSNTGVTEWINANCSAVTGFDTATRNAGAPDGTGNSQNTDGNRGGAFGGEMQVTLYDCGG